MKMKSAICFVCLSILAISARVTVTAPGPCIQVYQDGNVRFANAGDMWVPHDQCGVNTCVQGPSGTYTIEKRCDDVPVNEPCYLKSFPYKPYPECCENIVCEEEYNGSDVAHSGSEIDCPTGSDGGGHGK